MDGINKADSRKLVFQAAARPTGSDIGGQGAAATSFARVARGTLLPDGNAGNTVLRGPAAAGDVVDDDDEQLERFYALLANIRAMRRVYTPGSGEETLAGGGTRKRLRGAETPWRPAFRLEDFEDEATSATSRKKGRRPPDGEEDDGDGPAAVARAAGR